MKRALQIKLPSLNSSWPNNERSWAVSPCRSVSPHHSLDLFYVFAASSVSCTFYCKETLYLLSIQQHFGGGVIEIFRFQLCESNQFWVQFWQTLNDFFDKSLINCCWASQQGRQAGWPPAPPIPPPHKSRPVLLVLKLLVKMPKTNNSADTFLLLNYMRNKFKSLKTVLIKPERLSFNVNVKSCNFKGILIWKALNEETNLLLRDNISYSIILSVVGGVGSSWIFSQLFRDTLQIF